MKQAAVDPSTGKIDVSILTTGISGAARKRKAEVTQALKKLIQEKGKVPTLKQAKLFEELRERSDLVRCWFVLFVASHLLLLMFCNKDRLSKVRKFSAAKLMCITCIFTGFAIITFIPKKKLSLLLIIHSKCISLKRNLEKLISFRCQRYYKKYTHIVTTFPN